MTRQTLVSAACAVLALLATVALVPVSVSVTPVQPYGGEAVPAGWNRIDLPAESTVTIRKTGGSLWLAGSLETPETFDEALLVESKGFDYDATARTLVAGPGSASATLRGNFGDLTLAILPTSRPGTLTVERRSPATPALLSEVPQGSPTSISLPSSRAVFQRTSSYLFSSVQIPPELQRAGVEATAAREPIDVPPNANVISAMAAFVPALVTALTGWGTFLGAMCLLLVFWLIGRGLNAKGPSSPAAAILHTTLGLTLTATIGVSLTYLVPAWYAALLVGAAAVVVIGMGIVRGALRGALSEVKDLGRLAVWVTLPATVLFFPLLFWGTTYAGEYKTDLFFYGTGASIAENHSLLSMQNLPEAQQWVGGFGVDFRAIDSVLASMVSSVTPLTTVGALVLLGLALFYLFGITVLRLFDAHNPDSRTWLPVLVLFNPVFVGLFAENYYSHYWFIALIPGLVMSAHALWRSEPDLQVNHGLVVWTAAAVAAALTAVYPYFFIIVAGAILLVSLMRGAWRSQLRRNLWPLLWRTVLLTNISFVTLLGFFGAEAAGGERLDEITRNVLLSGYTRTQAVGLLAGFTPYQWRVTDIPSSDDMGWPGSLIWGAGGHLLTLGAIDVLIVAGLVLVLLTRVRWPETLTSFGSVTSLTIVAGFIGFSGLYALAGRPYPALKGFWTAAALVGLVLAVMTWKRSRRWIVGLFLVAASLLWILTALVDRVTWLLGAKTDAVARSHMSTAQDLNNIARLIRDEPGSVVIGVGSEQPLRESDQRRVLEANTQVLARDFDREFSQTVKMDQSFCMNVTAETGSIVVVGVSNEAELCGKTLVYRSTVVEVYQ